MTDPVTSLKSSRFLQEFLTTAIRQSRRYRVPLSILVLELDRGKELENELGQSGSIELLSQVGQHVAKQLRDSDIVARTGPFELTIVLTVTDNKGAIEVAERLRDQIRQASFPYQARQIKVTASLGLCQFSEAMDDQGSVILSHAHAALSQAQANGGDITLMAE
jgi:diguanylate cyclase (GGDEF)-like protein